MTDNHPDPVYRGPMDDSNGSAVPTSITYDGTLASVAACQTWLAKHKVEGYLTHDGAVMTLFDDITRTEREIVKGQALVHHTHLGRSAAHVWTPVTRDFVYTLALA